MPNANTEHIKQYILKLIDARDKDFARKTVEYFEVSKSSVYNYVKKMCEENVIRKTGGTFPYEIVTDTYEFKYKNDGTVGEDRAFRRDIEPLIRGYEKNVYSAWQYAFTEMMNNAIEHSSADEIIVRLMKDPLKTTVVIVDNGIGIFKNIQQFVKRERGESLELDECAALLFAGKFTTAKSYHSGEGIFFTSHLMDEFYIRSDDMFFSRNNFTDKTENIVTNTGTVVSMSLGNKSKKTTIEVFDRFSDIEDGFIRTHIPISHMFSYGNPVSRSEARRLGEIISGFKEIDLDFANVEEVGQAFCHELFVVWQNANADVVLNVSNAGENVDRMIRRVKNTK